jgi:hypothetical protein
VSQAKKRDDDQLFTAHAILDDPQEQRGNGPLYKWAKLVTERHAAGESITEADDWLGLLMAGVSPDEI